MMQDILNLLQYDATRPLLFTQAFFWFFFGFVWVIWLLFYKILSLRTLWLTAVSLYFYYLSSGFYFGLLLFSTLVDYLLGKAIYKTENLTRKKAYLIVSVVVNLALLGYFKYTYFFTDVLNHVAGTDIKPINFLAYGASSLGFEADFHHIFLPVGISFYTFQTLSYSIDIYRGKLTPVRSILDFAFFVSFFPQLVAGPIVRASDFIPQIYQKYRLTEAELGRAFYLILVGLFKKMVISDYLSINWVDRIFSEPVRYSGFENLLAIYGYAIQIYCDFSGYTDIAIGIALLLGFRLNLNFNSPYKATNITDFWRRWHISLSSWLRDYLYISLGGNRKGKVKTYANLLITMLLGGLWHGAHVRFIIWGALHGLALALHKMWLETFPSAQKKSVISDIISGIFTFHFVCFCWIFFRAETTAQAFEVIEQITTAFHPEIITDVLASYWQVVSMLGLGFVLHFLPHTWKAYAQTQLSQLPDFVKACVAVLVALLIFQVKVSDFQPFIYFQF